jgi:hypothetical protein
VSAKTQFEGRTAEEAVARARKALGDSDALRCWKTRKGGVGGFFTREVFVASLTPPPGSEETPGKGSGAPARGKNGGRAPRSVSDGSARSLGTNMAPQLPSGVPGDPQDYLSGLIDATSDQLSLRSLAIPADAFDQVLAEAQAALARLPEDIAPGAPERQPVLAEDEEAGVEPNPESSATPPQEAQLPEVQEPGLSATAGDVAATTAKAPAKPKPKPKPRSRPEAPAARPTATVLPRPRRPLPSNSTSRSPIRRLPDLKPGLRSLGVPGSFLPPGRRPSLDLLAEVMATLPHPAALPTGKGAVVAVVGAGDDLARTIDLVRSELNLGLRDVLQFGQIPGAPSEGARDVARIGGTRLDRQIARRRANGRRSVVVVHAAPGRSVDRETRGCLEYAAPDYVLAAVSAGCKRVDVKHWIGELPAVDALALWDLSGTRTPAELLGAAPIAFVDGQAGSALGWTLLLAGRAVGWRQ